MRWPLPHPLVLLCRGEDLRLPDEDVAEWPTAAALLVETGHRGHGQTLDHQGLGVGETGLLRDHAAHVAYVPAGREGRTITDGIRGKLSVNLNSHAQIHEYSYWLVRQYKGKPHEGVPDLHTETWFFRVMP